MERYILKDNEARSRYEFDLGGHTAYIDYEKDNGTIVLTHTFVPEAYEGRGVGAQLVAAALADRVLVIRLFPGLREQVLRAMLSIEGLRAVVLETYGAGNAPTAPEFIRAVREAVARGLLVMNVTQCSGGRVAMELYETGRQLQEAGVICGHDITTEAAIAKLMYVLGQNLPAERTQRLLRHALRGEFTDAGIA